MAVGTSAWVSSGEIGVNPSDVSVELVAAYSQLATSRVGKSRVVQPASASLQHLPLNEYVQMIASWYSMIAGEALFLDPSMKGEATYRLALHAGSFIEHPGHGRLAVFKFMRDAYGIRSDILHGRDNVRYRLLNGANGDVCGVYHRS